MKIAVNAIPMAGLLTGIARYLRNLYNAMAMTGETELFYFNGKQMLSAMPSLPDSNQRQQTIKMLRQLPDPLLLL